MSSSLEEKGVGVTESKFKVVTISALADGHGSMQFVARD